MKYLICPVCERIHPSGILLNWRIRYSKWRMERDMKYHPERITTIKSKEELDKFFKDLWGDE